MKKIKDILMERPQIMKTIAPSTCPHCKKEVLIDFQTMVPFMSGIISMDEVKEAKEDIKKKLDEIKFENESDKKEILAWLDKDSTLLGKADVEDILKQILTDNSKKDN